jgi:hypothetical protein
LLFCHHLFFYFILFFIFLWLFLFPLSCLVHDESSVNLERPGSSTLLIEHMKQLEPEQQAYITCVFAFATILPGHVPGAMTDLWRELTAAMGDELDEWPLRWLTYRFISGTLYVSDVEGILDAETREANQSTGCVAKLKYCADRTCVFCAI